MLATGVATAKAGVFALKAFSNLGNWWKTKGKGQFAKGKDWWETRGKASYALASGKSPTMNVGGVNLTPTQEGGLLTSPISLIALALGAFLIMKK
jgi:hypothetical protein